MSDKNTTVNQPAAPAASQDQHPGGDATPRCRHPRNAWVDVATLGDGGRGPILCRLCGDVVAR